MNPAILVGIACGLCYFIGFLWGRRGTVTRKIHNAQLQWQEQQHQEYINRSSRCYQRQIYELRDLVRAYELKFGVMTIKEG